MEKLQFVSRTGSALGKQRVFFSCHPEDFGRYFEPLTEEVLRIVDCAVYYYPPDAEIAADDGYLQQLQDMQLILLPVTEKLLQGGNRTLEVDLPFAKEQARNLPLLPIQCESGLEDAFSAKCGHWQLLDRTADDETAIPYEEKLAARLHAVIAGEELTARIRAAFDAYLFLSYRKTDRAYARALMRRIHQADRFRDIAIWYDELLTLGEDFDEGILAAMEKSALFVMAVTPNLLAPGRNNEENYVMGVEYKKARELNLPILPVELVPTDRQALRKGFEGIPDCVDGSDGNALEDALTAHLQAVGTGGKDPQHAYLIGLAYLNGIDMDIDRQKGLALITDAAEAGYAEAMDKLRNLFLYGEHVPQDMSKAAYWVGRLSERLEVQYRKDPTEAGAEKWLKSLWDWGDCLAEQGEPEKAFSAYLRLCAQGETLFERWGNPELRRTLALGYAKLGSCLRDRDKETAEEAFRDSIRHLIALGKAEYKPLRAAWDLAITAMRLGDLLGDEDPQEALQWFAHAEVLLTDALSKSESDRFRRRVKHNLAGLSQNIGRQYFAMGQNKKAKAYTLQAIRLCESLCDEKYGTTMLVTVRTLGDSHALLGNILFAEGQLVQAAYRYLKGYRCYDQAYGPDCPMCRSLSAKLDSMYLPLLAVLEQEHMRPGDWEGAETCCRILIPIAEEVWGKTTPKALNRLAELYGRFGIALANGQKPVPARQALTDALHYAGRYAQAAQTPDAVYQLAAAHEQLAAVSEKTLRVAHLGSALSLWKQLHACFPEDPRYAARLRNAKALLEQID